MYDRIKSLILLLFVVLLYLSKYHFFQCSEIQLEPSSASTSSLTSASSSTEDRVASPPKKKFCHLARKMASLVNSTAATNTVENELLKYCTMVNDDLCVGGPLQFWVDNTELFPKIHKFAQDLIAAPASEAYCERIFSLCGDLCARKRNRATVSLERQVFLKLNSKFI
jgi:hypothetical protein